MTELLNELGYRSQPLFDPSTQQPAQTVERFGEQVMTFSGGDHEEMRVEMAVRMNNSVTTLKFTEAGKTSLSPSGQQHYRELTQRLVERFGAAGVSY